MSLNDVNSYLTGPFRTIQGWCIPHLWQAIQPLYTALASSGITAPVAEIGVYHGKFFAGLVKMMGAPANNYAIDIFDLQEFNLDGSGRGNLGAFRESLQLSGIDESVVQILQTDSMSITEAAVIDLQRSVGGFSFFSVDGCHTVEHTINDLTIATKLTHHAGVICVDDYYNANWPGVQEGVAQHFMGGGHRFVPLAYLCNKLLLCHISWHARYLRLVEDFVRENFADTRIKRVHRFGYEGVTLTPTMTGDSYLRV